MGQISVQRFSKLPLHALIHDLKKKRYGHQLEPMTHFFADQKFDPLFYLWSKLLAGHLQTLLLMP